MTLMTVLKIEAGKKLNMESHKALFWDLYFFFYEIQMTYPRQKIELQHITFADDTSIINTHSNIIYFNKPLTKSLQI